MRLARVSASVSVLVVYLVQGVSPTRVGFIEVLAVVLVSLSGDIVLVTLGTNEPVSADL